MLTCRLNTSGRAAWRAGFDQFREQLALPRSVPTKGEVAAAMAAATQLEQYRWAVAEGGRCKGMAKGCSAVEMCQEED